MLGRTEAADFLADKPVKMIWGVGPATAKRMHDLGDLPHRAAAGLPARGYDPAVRALWRRLYDFCRGDDPRRVEGRAQVGQLETTLSADTGELAALTRAVERFHRVAERLARYELSGVGDPVPKTPTLKF